MFVASGALQVSPAAGLNQFSESIPISLGDHIGVDDPGPGFVLIQTGMPITSYRYASYLPLSNGSPTGPGETERGAELLLNAEISPTNTFTVTNLSKSPFGRPFLGVTVPNPGSLTIEGVASRKDASRKPIVRPLSLSQTGVGQVHAPLRLTKSARGVLRTNGKVVGTVRITFTPAYGTPSTQTARVRVLRRSK